MNDDVLEPRTGIRVLANNEIAAVAGAMDGIESFHFAIGMATGTRDVSALLAQWKFVNLWNLEWYFAHPDVPLR